jgi:hypothetical protein
MSGPRLGRGALLVLTAISLAGCAVTPAGSARPSIDPSGLQVVVVSTSTWTGAATVLVALEEADGRPVVPPAQVSIRLVGPNGTPTIEIQGDSVRPLGGRRDLIRASADLPFAGRWELTVRAVDRSAKTIFLVRDPAGVPIRGDKAPSVATPTAVEVRYDLTRLTADPHPNPDFYRWSVADALAAHVPFALVLDSAGFRETPACGAALSTLHRLAGEAPSVAKIHAEPYATRIEADRLALDPPSGPARLAPWSEAWGLASDGHGTASIPWVFVVDASGRVRATFQGIIGSEEVGLALGEVAGGQLNGGVASTGAPSWTG